MLKPLSLATAILLYLKSLKKHTSSGADTGDAHWFGDLVKKTFKTFSHILWPSSVYGVYSVVVEMVWLLSRDLTNLFFLHVFGINSILLCRMSKVFIEIVI